ncbi:hypothetical protein CEUSTIGMA_g12936.t1 [Chlamydomonas eustigma]|uniref:Uncharacterized protein n=1 Tax=Chlamydomonas eustigma TaxID=1157962 RepID=A0A250XRU7_9CHLO|nr:hypothetical protein CEUSTIGMA_g12936.t1 [Chlamydomonas eustigma]|eukprot:GAX85520.1 hypothetical protein CEUSTIGMA_g12936.t1 [Chlamydomonas eustigma]
MDHRTMLLRQYEILASQLQTVALQSGDDSASRKILDGMNNESLSETYIDHLPNNNSRVLKTEASHPSRTRSIWQSVDSELHFSGSPSSILNNVPNQQHAASLSAGTANRPSNPTPHSYLPTLMEGQFTALQSSKDLVDQNSETYEEQVSQNYKQKEVVRHSHNYDSEQRHTAELFQRRQYPGLPRPQDPGQVQEGRMCATDEHQQSSNKNAHPRGAGNGTCSAGTHYSLHHPAQAQHHHPHSSTQSQEVSYSSDHMPEAHSQLNPEHEEGTERGLFQQIDDRTQAAMRLKVQQQVQQNSPLLPEFVTKLCDEQGTTLLTRHVSLLESGSINQHHLPSSTADCLSVRSDSVSTSNKCQRVCQEDRPDSAHSLSFGANVDENTSGKLTSEGAQHTSSTTIAGQKGRGSSNDDASRQQLPKLPPFTRRLTSSSSSSSSKSDSHNNSGITSDGSSPKLQNPGTTSDGSNSKLQNPGTTSDGSRIVILQLPERKQDAGSSSDYDIGSRRNEEDGGRLASRTRCRSEETCSASDIGSSSRSHAMSRRYASSSDPHYHDQQQADSPSSTDPENNSGNGRSSSRQDSLFLRDKSRHRRSFKSSRKVPNRRQDCTAVVGTTTSRPAISEASSSTVSGQAIMNTTRMAQHHEDRVDHTHQAAPAASPPYLNTSAQNNDVNKRPAAGKQAISKSPARHLKPAGRSIDDIDVLDQLQRATIRLEWMDDRRQPLLLPLNIVLQDKQEAGLRAEHSSLYRCLDVLLPPPPLQRNSMQHKRREAETTALFSPPRDQATALYDVSAGLLAGMKSDTVLQKGMKSDTVLQKGMKSDTVLQKGDNDHCRKQPAAVISHARSEYRRKPGYEETGSEQDNGSALQRHDSSWRGSRGARVPAKVRPSMQEIPRRGSALKLFDASACVGNPTSSATAEASSSGSIMPGFMKTTSHRFKESADFLLKAHALQKIAMDQKWSSQQAALRRRGQSVNQASSTTILSHQHHLNIDETYRIGGLEKQSSIENLSQQALLVQDLNKIKQDYPSCSNEKLDTSNIHNHRSSLRSSLDDASTSTSESDVAQWVSRASRHAQLLPLMTSDSEEEETDTGRRALLKQAYERARAEVIGSHALAADGEEKREEDCVQLQWHQIPEDISGIRGSIIRNKHRVLLNTREDLLNEKQQQPEVVHEASLQIKRESKTLLEDLRDGRGMMTEVAKNSHRDMTSKHSRRSRHPNMTPNEQHDGHRSCSRSRQQQDPEHRRSSSSSSRRGGHCTPDRGCGGGRQLRNLTPEYGRAGRRLKLTTIPQGHRGRMRHEETLLPEHSRFSSSSTRRPLTPGPYSRQYNSDKRPSPPSAGVMTRSRSCMRSHDLSKRSYYEGPEIAVACPRRNYIATDSIAKTAESMEVFTAGGHGCPTRENSVLLVPSVMQNDRASQGAPEIITAAPAAGNDHGVIIQQREAVLAPILDQLRVLLQSLETKLSVSDIQKDSASTQEPISTSTPRSRPLHATTEIMEDPMHGMGMVADTASTPRSRPLHATTEIMEDPMHGMGMVADAAWSPLTMNRNHSSTSATSAASATFTSTVTPTLSHGSAAVTSATKNRLSSGGSAAAAALAAATTLEHMLSATLSSLPPPATAGPASSGTNSRATSSAGSAVVCNDTLVRLAEAGKQVEAMTAILNQFTANRVPHAAPVTE